MCQAFSYYMENLKSVHKKHKQMQKKKKVQYVFEFSLKLIITFKPHWKIMFHLCELQTLNHTGIRTDGDFIIRQGHELSQLHNFQELISDPRCVLSCHITSSATSSNLPVLPPVLVSHGLPACQRQTKCPRLWARCEPRRDKARKDPAAAASPTAGYKDWTGYCQDLVKDQYAKQIGSGTGLDLNPMPTLL